MNWRMRIASTFVARAGAAMIIVKIYLLLNVFFYLNWLHAACYCECLIIYMDMFQWPWYPLNICCWMLDQCWTDPLKLGRSWMWSDRAPTKDFFAWTESRLTREQFTRGHVEFEWIWRDVDERWLPPIFITTSSSTLDINYDTVWREVSHQFNQSVWP